MVAAVLYENPGMGRSARRIAAVALAWGIFVQAIGALCYPNGAWNTTPIDVDRAHERLWDWRDQQIVRTMRGGLYTNHLAQMREE
jgi:hypothetical protein